MNSPRILAIRKWLTSRPARNVYFWVLALYVAFTLNAGNDKAYNYGITSSSWYLPVMGISLLLQCTLVYSNNFWLVPHFLVKRKRLAYGVLLLALASSVSVLFVLLFKMARTHINVEEIQHAAFTNTIISGQWTATAILTEAQTFFISELLWVFAFTMAWYMNDYSRQHRALQQAEQQRTQTELAFLKNQINPHFLFNTLNNIYGLALKKEDTAADAILKLSSMLRYLLYESETPTISFQKEKAAIEAYVEIEALRLPDDATIRLEISADKDYMIPALLWMPIVENVFKHGTRLIALPINVVISFRIEKSKLSITTENNFLTDANMARNGIGLANLRKRLDLLYSGHYTLEQQDEGTIYRCVLNIELT